MIHQKSPRCVERALSKATYIYQIDTPTTPSQKDLPKETYTYKKKPTCMKRTLSKETYIYQTDTLTTPYSSQKDLPKETYAHEKKPTYLKRALSNRRQDIYLKKLTNRTQKRPAKETC